jgi:hypothetical protein
MPTRANLKFLRSAMMDIDDIQALHRLANRAVASGQAALLQYDALVIGQEVPTPLNANFTTTWASAFRNLRNASNLITFSDINARLLSVAYVQSKCNPTSRVTRYTRANACFGGELLPPPPECSNQLSFLKMPSVPTKRLRDSAALSSNKPHPAVPQVRHTAPFQVQSMTYTADPTADSFM